MSNANTPLEQETKATRASLELLYRVSHELAIAPDFSTVLQRALSLSMNAIGAYSGSIIILNEKGNPVDSAIIYQGQVIKHTTKQLQATLEQGLAGWVVRNQKAAWVSDTSTDERWLHRPDDEESATGPKSVVAAPILTHEQLVGVVTLAHPEPNQLTEEHLNLVKAIADQASVAVLKARLYDESQRQAQVMTALTRSAKAMTSSIQLEHVLDSILGQIKDALQVEAVALALVNHEKHELEYKAAIYQDSSEKSELLGKRIPTKRGLVGWVAEHDTGIVVPDVENDSRFDPQLNVYPQLIPTAVACAPIRLRGNVIGVLEAVNPKSGSFSFDALLVLTGIGSLAGSSIQNAQLFEEVQVAHNRYHDLFENSIDPIIITDFQGNILEINRQTIRTIKFSPEVLLDMSITDIHKINWEKVGKDFENLQTGKTCSYESFLRLETGNAPPIRVTVHSIRISQKTRLQWTFRDISERKKLDKLRDDLASMIYHDLRSPLANVVSSLDVLNATLNMEDEPEIRSLFDIATRSTERIQRLTKSLLDINRLEAGQAITRKEPTYMREIADKAYEALIPIANNKKQTITINVAEDLPPALVDSDMIERVAINLLQNAIKYTPMEGKIEIGAQQEEETLRFWVRDTGPGIEPKAQDEIFNKFTRLHPSGRIQGLGLGLAFCRLAVEGHNGRIWVENASQGGSIFSFTLPIAAQEKED
ncbi:MAG: hypothetical protein DRI56_11135 [Chloroflexota bacterium]|nr:MAG: hypothetical protein DRI56_11135 [Chloroflexota bacterium]